MRPEEDRNELIELMAELKEMEILDAVRRDMSEGVDPLAIIDQCHKGMIRVGQYYEEGRYFISALIMAGEIMVQVGQLVFPLLENRSTSGDAGCVVLGTVEGDIHFVGKDIFKVLVRGYGFTVHDLGVDVPKTRFLAAMHELEPDIVGISCLISSAFKGMEETIALLRGQYNQSAPMPTYIIGGRVDGLVCEACGADYWTRDAMEGVRLCQSIMESARKGTKQPLLSR